MRARSRPARAITEPCWALPDASVAEQTLAELLAERHAAKAASDAWLYQRDVVQRRRDDIDELRSIASVTTLADWLGSHQAAEMLRMLVGTDPAAFLDTEPDLARQIVDWCVKRRRVNRFKARDLAQPLIAELEQRHAATWADQARRLLAARDHIAADHPRLHRLATTLAAGNLLSDNDSVCLNAPPAVTHAEIQQEILGGYHARRSSAVQRHWLNLSHRDRRRVGREQLAAAYDAENLLVCDTCELAYPTAMTDDAGTDRCAHCDGTLLEWRERPTSVALDELLAVIRGRVTSP